MHKGIVAIFICLSLLLSGVCFSAEEADEVIAALDALLIGVRYPSEQSDPNQWSDSTLRDTIYNKLLWDDFLISEDSFLHEVGLTPLPSENRYLHFSLENIQKLTRSIFGRDFPSYIYLEHIFIWGNELVIARETGERTLLRVQDYVERDGTIVAVGIGVRQFGTHAEFLGCFEAVFEPSSESVYGYALLSIKPIEDQMSDGLSATASSELKEIDKTYRAANAIDGDLSTVWAEGAKGLGMGEWLQINAEEGKKLHLSAIGLFLGAQKDDQPSEETGRPYKIALEFENGIRQEAELQTCEDVIVLDQPITSSWVKLTILEALKGNRHSICSISEIRLHGVDASTYFPEREITAPTEEATTQAPTEEATTQAPTEPVTQEETEPATAEAPETTEAPAIISENAPLNGNNPTINTLILVILGAIVVGAIACFVVLLVILKKKGSL